MHMYIDPSPLAAKSFQKHKSHVNLVIYCEFFPLNDFVTVFSHSNALMAKFDLRGARWLIGRASDSGARGWGVRNLPQPCCVLEQDTLLPESTGHTQEAVAPSRHE